MKTILEFYKLNGKWALKGRFIKENNKKELV